MVSVLLSLLAAPWCVLLSHGDFFTREAATTVVAFLGDREAVLSLRRETADPEVRVRCSQALKVITIRDLDRLAISLSPTGYPRADTLSGWRLDPSFYGVVDSDYGAYFVWLAATPEFYGKAPYPNPDKEQPAEGEMYYSNDHLIYPDAPEQQEHTRVQLCKYLVRTHDWDTATRILKGTRK